MDSSASYLKKIQKYQLLSEPTEFELQTKAEHDAQARKDLYNGNLRLVVSVAKRYIDYGLPPMKLIDSGNTALLNAISTWKLEKKIKPSSWYVWWIHKGICMEIAKTLLPSITKHTGDSLKRGAQQDYLQHFFVLQVISQVLFEKNFGKSTEAADIIQQAVIATTSQSKATKQQRAKFIFETPALAALLNNEL